MQLTVYRVGWVCVETSNSLPFLLRQWVLLPGHWHQDFQGCPRLLEKSAYDPLYSLLPGQVFRQWHFPAFVSETHSLVLYVVVRIYIVAAASTQKHNLASSHRVRFMKWIVLSIIFLTGTSWAATSTTSSWGRTSWKTACLATRRALCTWRGWPCRQSTETACLRYLVLGRSYHLFFSLSIIVYSVSCVLCICLLNIKKCMRLYLCHEWMDCADWGVLLCAGVREKLLPGGPLHLQERHGETCLAFH